MKCVDLNCDVGEVAEAIANGTQEQLMGLVSSVNIACGAHAGNADTMRATIEQALTHHVAIGAHPGYDDRANFGRTELQLDSAEISESVRRQVEALDSIATQMGARITHVKPHGALYNQAARDRRIALAIADGVRRWRRDVLLVGLASSVMLEVFRAAGFATAAEAFADRRYEKDGNLRSRKLNDAVLANAEQAARQALEMVHQGRVTTTDGTQVPLLAQTICIHGDTPGAVGMASRIRRELESAGVKIASLRGTGASEEN